MNYHSLALEFEKASLGMQNDETRKKAEEFLNEVTDSKEALNICKLVLDNSLYEVAQFQASSIISKRIPIDFFALSSEEVSQLRDYLFTYCLQRPNLPSHTRETLLQCIALIFKFSWVRNSNADVKEFLNKVINFPFVQNFEKYLVLSLMKAVLSEFMINNATKLGLTGEMHLRCKEEFQDIYLLKIFITVGTILKNYLSDNSDPDIHTKMNFPLIISQLLEVILTWNFKEEDDFDEEDYGRSNISYASSFVKNFPKEWFPYFTSDELIDLLFKLQTRMLDIGEDISAIDQAIITLSGISRSKFNNDFDRIRFIQKYMHQLNDKIVNGYIDFEETEMTLVPITEMIGGLVTDMSTKEFSSIPESLTFLQNVGTLTLKALINTKEEDDDGRSGDAFDFLLEALATIASHFQNEYNYDFQGLQQGSNPSEFEIGYKIQEYFKNFSGLILQTYLDVRINCSIELLISGQKERDFYFLDWVLYEDQLVKVAALARNNPIVSLGLLYTNILVTFQKVQESFKKFDGNADPEDYTIEVLFEHLHWYTILAAFILADKGDGEAPVIPSQVNNYSAQHKDASTDLVILIPSFLFNALLLLTFDESRVEYQLCSQDYAQTIFWFLERWTRTYLFPNKDDNYNLSNNIISTFGTSSYEDVAGRRVLNLLMELIHRNYKMWIDRPTPIPQIASLVNLICSKQESRTVLYNSEKFLNMAVGLINNMTVSVRDANGVIIKAVILVATASPNVQLQNGLLTLLDERITYLINNVIKLITSDSFSETKAILLACNVIEMLQGFGLACDFTNSIKIFRCYSKYLEPIYNMTTMLPRSREVWWYIFHSITTMTMKMDLFEFQAPDLEILIGYIINVYQFYCANYSMLMDIPPSSDLAEEYLPDLEECLMALFSVMQLENENGKDSELVKTGLTSAIFTIFPLVMDLMTFEHLKENFLAGRFTNILSLLIQQYPLKLKDLEPRHLDFIMQSLTFLTRSCEPRTAQFSYNCIFILGVNAWKTDYSFLKQYFEIFLKEMMKTLISPRIDWSMIDFVSDALVMTIVLQAEIYDNIARVIVSRCSMAGTEERFTQLLIGLKAAAIESFDGTRPGKPALDLDGFREKVLEFIRGTRGISKGINF